MIEQQNGELKDLKRKEKEQQLLDLYTKTLQLQTTWKKLEQRLNPQILLKADMQLFQEKDILVAKIIHNYMDRYFKFKHFMHKKESEIEKLLNLTRKQKQEKQSEIEKLFDQQHEQDSRFISLMQENISEIEQRINYYQLRE